MGCLKNLSLDGFVDSRFYEFVGSSEYLQTVGISSLQMGIFCVGNVVVITRMQILIMTGFQLGKCIKIKINKDWGMKTWSLSGTRLGELPDKMEQFTKHLWGLLRTVNLSSVMKQQAAGNRGNVFRKKKKKHPDAGQKSVQE